MTISNGSNGHAHTRTSSHVAHDTSTSHKKSTAKKGTSKMKAHTTTHETNAATPNTTAAETPATTPPQASSSVASSTAAAVQPPISAAQVTQILSELNTIPTLLSTVAPLSIAERQQQVRIRKGGDKLVPAVLGYAVQYGLTIPDVSTDDAKADLALSSTLQPLAARLGVLTTLVNDAILQAEGRAWKAATTAYSMLTMLVPSYPALQTELAPMASLLASKYKDAPTSLRKKEAKQLAKKRKAKKSAKAAAAASAPNAASAGTPVSAAPVVADAPSVAPAAAVENAVAAGAAGAPPTQEKGVGGANA